MPRDEELCKPLEMAQNSEGVVGLTSAEDGAKIAANHSRASGYLGQGGGTLWPFDHQGGHGRAMNRVWNQNQLYFRDQNKAEVVSTPLAALQRGAEPRSHHVDTIFRPDLHMTLRKVCLHSVPVRGGM